MCIKRYLEPVPLKQLKCTSVEAPLAMCTCIYVFEYKTLNEFGISLSLAFMVLDAMLCVQ